MLSIHSVNVFDPLVIDKSQKSLLLASYYSAIYTGQQQIRQKGICNIQS